MKSFQEKKKKDHGRPLIFLLLELQMERTDDRVRIVDSERPNICHQLNLGSTVASHLSVSITSEGIGVLTLP